MKMTLLLRRPSALIPMAMSVIALALVITYISFFGIAREADEGAVAHLWQLLIVGQVPIVAFFLFKWLPRAPRPAFVVLVVQIVALCAALAPVYLLHL